MVPMRFYVVSTIRAGDLSQAESFARSA